MYQCPITYFKDNLIFNQDKSVWAVFKMTGYDYDFLADDAKIRILYKTARFLSGILSEAQILIVPTQQDNQEHFKALVHQFSREDPLYENAVLHARQTERYLEEQKSWNGAANDYRTYLLIKLAENNEYELVDSLRQGIQYFLKDPINAVNVFMNLDTKDLLESRLEQSIKMAEKWFYSQNQKLRLSKVETEELQWLIKRSAFRGMSGQINLFYANQKRDVWEPEAEYLETEGGEKIIKPFGRDVLNLFSGSIYQGKRYLKIVQDKNRVSYQTFLAITHIPEPLEHPGSEWLYMLQQLNEQAEVCIHIKMVEYRDALRKVTRKKMEIDSQMEHIAGANADIPEDLAEGKEYADMLEGELKGQKAPLLNTSILICLAAETVEDLERKTATVRGIYEDMSFGIERPLADQLKMYLQCLPSVGACLKDYVMPLTPLTLASGVLGATHELGDNKGGYIGTTGAEGKHVFLDLGRACLLNRSASATFFGNLGVGKSFNANLLLFLTILYGGYGLIFDPKGERSHWKEQLKILNGQIHVVTLSPDNTNKGKMDPYNMYLDHIDEADELALNVISELLKIAPASMEYTAILEAQRKMRCDPVPSMMRLISILNSFPEEDELYKCAKFLARRLYLQSENGMSKLLFGDGSEEAISLDNRLNILQIENLKLPSQTAAKESYTNEETLSTVLMAVAAHFAKKFALVKRPVFKVILFDESWMLGKTVEGVKLYDFLSRMGRSLYTGCIFNGHSVLDIPNEGIKNTITYKFCFQTNNDSEAARMCEYLELEPTQENKEVLKNLRNGECLFQDLDRHVGILRFDAVFQDIIEVFSTTPKTELAEVTKEERTAKDLSSNESLNSEKTWDEKITSDEFAFTEENKERFWKREQEGMATKAITKGKSLRKNKLEELSQKEHRMEAISSEEEPVRRESERTENNKTQNKKTESKGKGHIGTQREGEGEIEDPFEWFQEKEETTESEKVALSVSLQQLTQETLADDKDNTDYDFHFTMEELLTKEV